ncbi:MAG: Gfo/Idh/MocA family oxidoreductase, partial [Anaerolineae bacterium]|nr:Gfo/Idh/MocA family oxidoreductase [Anaerolineae bacterium]
MAIRIGICGTGSFADNFIPLFKAHPDVEHVILCDLDHEKLQAKCQKFGITDSSPSLDDLCERDIDAIAIITQHHLHGPQAVQALKAGKHVYSAVPSAISVDEMAALVKTVEVTGNIYMIGETSYYYPCAIFCRKQFQQGKFGHIVYAEGEYYHDYSHGLYQVHQNRHGAKWQQYYGMPPLFYPTHSTSMIVSVTGAHATHVCGMGFVDRHEDNLYGRTDNVWNNPFSNETMLCRMSDGSTARINEFRRIGHPGTVGMSLYGTEASYEQQTSIKGTGYSAVSGIWVEKNRDDCLDVSEFLSCKGIAIASVDGKHAVTGATGGRYEGVSTL